IGGRLTVGGEGSHHQAVAFPADPPELPDGADVDQLAGGCQPDLHHRQEAVSPRQELRLPARVLQQPESFFHRTGPCIFKAAGNHASPLPFCIAFHTFSGVRGISRSFTPKGFSASTTAFTTAGVEAMVPVSPMPFTPRGLTGEGVSVNAVSKSGKKRALGMA